MALSNLVISFLILLLTLNLAVMTSLFKRPDITREQRIYQSIFIVLIPFIGALVVWAFHKNEDRGVSKVNTGRGGSGLDDYTVGGTGID